MGNNLIAITALSLVGVALLAACQSKQANYEDEAYEKDTTTTIPFDKEGRLAFIKQDSQAVAIDIEIAETDSARKRGLMERASLPDSSGMLFTFPSLERSGFWMANTPLALDIIFVSPDSQIVDIAKYAKPLSSKKVPSRKPYRYVVEVPAGFADTHGLVMGHRVRWRRD